jgi:hypothetical protein
MPLLSDRDKLHVNYILCNLAKLNNKVTEGKKISKFLFLNLKKIKFLNFFSFLETTRKEIENSLEIEITSPQVLSSCKFLKKENITGKTLSNDQPREAQIISLNFLKISEFCQHYLLTIYDPINRKSISKIFSLNYSNDDITKEEMGSRQPALKSAFSNYYNLMQKENFFSYVDSFSNFYV